MMSAPKLGFKQNFVRERLYGRYRSNQSALEVSEEIRKRSPYLRRLIKRHFPENKNARILDLGCGTGTLLTILRETGYINSWGVDYSAEQVTLAQSVSVLGITHDDIFRFLETRKNESYDLILTFDVIEHLDRAELLNLADEVYRTLSPAGSWIIHTANAEGPFGGRVRYSDLTHEQAFTRDSIEQLSRSVGFTSTKCLEDEPVIHGLKSLVRWLIWKTGRAVIRLYFMAETGEAAGQSVISQNLLAVLRK